MAGESSDKVVTAVFIAIFIAAIGAYIYVSLPHQGGEKEQPATVEYVLTVEYGNEVRKYTMDELKSMMSVSGYGGYIKKNNVTVGPNLYKGIPIKNLLQEFSLPGNYSITVIAGDGYTKNFSIDTVKGKVDIYSENGSYLGIKNLTMIVAYEKDGDALGEDEGPLRIAFVSDEGYITSSSLWVKNVVSIKINV